MGISRQTLQALRDRAHDAIHLRERGLARAEDAAILSQARSEDRIILTFDLDFGELLALSRSVGPSVVVFRLQDQTAASVTPKLLEVLDRCEADLLAGVIVVVEETRFRVRRLPIGA
jgi:predicted nuclease of predicted toxin-antitoxin system